MELDFLDYNGMCGYHWVRQEQSRANIIKASYSLYQVVL